VGDAGRVIAQFVDFLSILKFTDPSRVNIIGHSLGSHVAGHAGKQVRLGRINAIFGTDPASYLFSSEDRHNRLDMDDAVYVESIVTNTGIYFEKPIAHANFYPSWGGAQPG
jgi:pimeloyl-ACP methyl ester carboxylesterase